jgi:hypothetical protein
MRASPRAFLFVVWEGGGNLPPILGLAQRLVERGHSVRVISDPCNEQEVLSTGATFVPYTRAPRRHDRHAASTRTYAPLCPRLRRRLWNRSILRPKHCAVVHNLL